MTEIKSSPMIMGDIHKRIKCIFDTGILICETNEVKYVDTAVRALKIHFVRTSDQKVYAQSWSNAQLDEVFGNRYCVSDIEELVSNPYTIIQLDANLVVILEHDENNLKKRILILDEADSPAAADKTDIAEIKSHFLI